MDANFSDLREFVQANLNTLAHQVHRVLVDDSVQATGELSQLVTLAQPYRAMAYKPGLLALAIVQEAVVAEYVKQQPITPFSVIMGDVKTELVAAMAKFPEWPDDIIHAGAIVAEEVGETAKELLQLVYEPHKTDVNKLRKEAIQSTAMLVRFIASLDVYHLQPASQHKQDVLKPL